MTTETFTENPPADGKAAKIPVIADAYYSRKDLEAMGICGWLTALRHERRGKLRASRIGRLVRYRGADIIQWLEGCKTG